ncbi:cytochrome b5 domain-containing protein 1 [Grus japonensis]|uniref:Cytochrome b5 domain-containing protein 1 n=1 Tax=Grus japonensis TaxID=30415 RepID=A0ABC9XU18_GRUJA
MATDGAAAARPRLLLRREVAARARLGWVSACGRGLRLGPGLGQRPGDPQLLEAAGSDVTHWFDPQTGHSPPWWGDPQLEVGRLTAAPRRLRLCNTLTGQEQVIEACGEQAGGLVQRALPWNAHAGGYAWRCGGAPLHPDQPSPDPHPDGSPPTVLLYFTDDFIEQ